MTITSSTQPQFIPQQPSPSVPPMPMHRKEAKAQGLKVFPSWTYCRRSSKHGNLRYVHSNRCVDCVQLERNLTKQVEAKALAKLEEKVRRKLEKEMQARISEAQQAAEEIIRRAEKEATNKAKMLEKAKATREAKKAALAASSASEGGSQRGAQADQLVAPWG